MSIYQTFLAVAAVIPLVTGFAIAQISLPDSDDFGSVGDPPTGWVDLVDGWSSDGSRGASAGTRWNDDVIMRSTGENNTYTYDNTKRLVVRWRMMPNVGNESGSKMGVELFTPAASSPVFGSNGGVGYFLMYISGGTLRLYRDARQWDHGGISLVSTNIGTAVNTAWTTYKIEVTYTGAETANWKVYVDGAVKIDYDDTIFLPEAGWTASGNHLDPDNFDNPAYVQYKAGIHWRSDGVPVGSGLLDDWSVSEESTALSGTVIRIR